MLLIATKQEFANKIPPDPKKFKNKSDPHRQADNLHLQKWDQSLLNNAKADDTKKEETTEGKSDEDKKEDAKEDKKVDEEKKDDKKEAAADDKSEVVELD